MEKHETCTLSKTKTKKDHYLREFLQYKISLQNELQEENSTLLDKLKQQYVLFLLEITNYNLIETANILNASRKVSDQKLKEELSYSFLS